MLRSPQLVRIGGESLQPHDPVVRHDAHVIGTERACPEADRAGARAATPSEVTRSGPIRAHLAATLSLRT
jgi:hypothetical protein